MRVVGRGLGEHAGPRCPARRTGSGGGPADVLGGEGPLHARPRSPAAEGSVRRRPGGPACWPPPSPGCAGGRSAAAGAPGQRGQVLAGRASLTAWKTARAQAWLDAAEVRTSPGRAPATDDSGPGSGPAGLAGPVGGVLPASGRGRTVGCAGVPGPAGRAAGLGAGRAARAAGGRAARRCRWEQRARGSRHGRVRGRRADRARRRRGEQLEAAASPRAGPTGARRGILP